MPSLVSNTLSQAVSYEPGKQKLPQWVDVSWRCQMDKGTKFCAAPGTTGLGFRMVEVVRSSSGRSITGQHQISLSSQRHGDLQHPWLDLLQPAIFILATAKSIEEKNSSLQAFPV